MDKVGDDFESRTIRGDRKVNKSRTACASKSIFWRRAAAVGSRDSRA
jgi:hypothetical protein